MTDKQIIIDDQKKTIHRLQDECTEKTNAIIALGEQLDQLKSENKHLNDLLNQALKELEKTRETLTEIKDIAEKEVNNRMLFADKESFCDFNQILQKISEVEDET